jgi:hypothetical protein
MHRIGAHAKALINRANGDSDVLLDQPYDFREQGMYRLPLDGSGQDVVVRPGDTITSTCTFNNNTDQPVSYGESSTDEMCFMLLLAWPAGQLINGSLTGLIFPGALPDVNCLEP